MTTTGEIVAQIFCFSGVAAVLAIAVFDIIIFKLFNRRTRMK